MKKMNRVTYLALAVIIGVSAVTPVSAAEYETKEEYVCLDVSGNDTVSENDIEITDPEIGGLDEYLESMGIVNGTLPEDWYAEFPERNNELQLYTADNVSQLGIDVSAASYDPRELGKVSAVRAQVSGTCWLYAGIAACESNLIHKGLADSSVDLSELQALYFAKNGFTDKLGNYVFNSSFASMTMEEYMLYGGDSSEVASLFAQWCGPVAEEKARIPSVYEVNGHTEQINYVANAVLDSSLAQEAEYHLCGTRMLSGNRSNPIEVIPYVKELIANYGGISGSYFSGTNYKVVENGGDNTYYFPYQTSANHAIEIIGWDDNFSASSFLKTPPGDGAWLCKNSQGEEVSYSNGITGNGYVWISYYDKTLCDFIAFDLEEADKYENIYGYCSKVNDIHYLEGKDESRIYHIMPVFEASAYEEGDTEKIEAVLIDSYNANKEYKVTLYANPVVEDGKLISYTGKTDTKTLYTDYAGMYKMDFSDDPLYVLDGNTFGIYIETNCIISVPTSQICKAYTNKADDYFSAESVLFTEKEVILTENDTKQIIPTVLPETVTKKECYYSSSDESVAVVDVDGTVRPVGFGECDIIATSYDGCATGSYHVVVKCTQLSLEENYVYTGETLQMIPNTLNDIKGITADKITWEVNDTSIAEISADGVLSGKKAGKVTVTVRLKENTNVYASCTVIVKQRMSSLKVNNVDELNSMRLFVGDTEKISATISPADTSDIVLSYTILGNGNYTISVDQDGLITALQPGTASIEVKSTDGSNLSQIITITVLEKIEYINIYIDNGNGREIKQNRKSSVTVQFSHQASTFSDKISISFSKPDAVEISNVTCYYDYEFEMLVKEAGPITMAVVLDDEYKTTTTIDINVRSDGSGTGTGNNINTPKNITSNKMTYKVSGNNLTLSSISSTSSSISIPSKVNYQGKSYTVTKIAAKAFKGNTRIKKIVIPGTVTEIGTSAFEGCTKLTSVTIGKKVTKIGKKAFYNCSSLQKVSIPGNVTEIGEAVFSGCKKLTTATIGAKVKKIGKKAFYNCSSLKKVTVPASVTEIGASAFENCKKLTSATIGKNVKKIGAKAFYNCQTLKTVTFKGTKVSSIGSKAFTKMSKKGSIKVPKGKQKVYEKLLKGKYTSGVKLQ